MAQEHVWWKLLISESSYSRKGLCNKITIKTYDQEKDRMALKYDNRHVYMVELLNTKTERS